MVKHFDVIAVSKIHFNVIFSKTGAGRPQFVNCDLSSVMRFNRARPPPITNTHPSRCRIASQMVSSTLTRAYHLQFDSTIVQGAYGVLVRNNISSTASRY